LRETRRIDKNHENTFNQARDIPAPELLNPTNPLNAMSMKHSADTLTKQRPHLLGASLATACLIAGATLASAGVIHVPADQPTIVAALDASFAGDEILIETGTYDEIDLLFLYDTLTLTATNGPVTVHVPSSRDAAVWVANGKSNIVVNGITFERPTTDQTWMRSAQLNTDSSSTFNNCTFTGPGHGVGAILFFGADGTFNNCTFSNFNPAASWAAGIFIEGRGATYSDVVVSNCVFETGCNQWIKTADFDGWTADQSKVGVGKVIVKRSTFKPATFAQALKFRNGGKLSIEFDPTQELLFEDCTFEGTTLEVAEFHYTTNSQPVSLKFSRCEFKAYNSGRKMFWLDLPTPITFENCLFAGGQHQTIMTVWGGPPKVDFFHCTMITDGIGGTNSTFINGWDGGRTFNIVNSLFRSPVNYTPGFVGDETSPTNRNYAVFNSVIDHATPTGAKAQITPGAGYSNTSLASAFVNPAIRDYHLLNGSPWVGGGMDLGYTLDLDRNPRNQGGAPDMGAYESTYASAGSPTVSIARSGSNLVITFAGVLQSADQLPGTFADVSGATNPWTVSATNAFKFFRARSPGP
jgi:hypothetical protein